MGLICGDRRLSRDTLLGRAARAATGLASLGIGSGDIVAVYLRNDIAFFEASYAAGLLGAYPTPVNWHYTPEEAAYLFADSGAKALVIHADLLEPVAATIPANVTVLVVPTSPEIAAAYGIAPRDVPDGHLDWNDWLAGFAPRAGDAAAAPGTIVYTSGTTGRPKGVRRAPPSTAQQQLFADLLDRGLGFAGRRPADVRTVITGPLYHSAPNAHALYAARIGAEVFVPPRFDPEELLALIARERITHLFMVPIMFHRLLALPAEVRAAYDVSSLRHVSHGAAPCPVEVKRAMIAWWGPVIEEYYGSTETGRLVACDSHEWLAHPGTVGRPIPEAIVRVVDAQGGAVAAGERGEVVGRTTGLNDFTYLGDDAKRAASDRDGLIATGDIGYFDADGFLFLCDRASDMIISGGANIYPAEIEAALLEMPGVVDCAVFGIPDPEFGESVYAVVQPAAGQAQDAEAVRTYLRGRISSFKVPRRVDFAPSLPREDSGKIFKRKLRAPFWQDAGRAI